ncbi:hypothetical protein D3C72_1858820 [compost metagenome]
MLQLDRLTTDSHGSAAAGCEIDGPDRYRSGQPQRVCSRGTIRNDHLATLVRNGFDGLLDRRWPASKAALDCLEIDPPTGPNELAAFIKTR